MVTMSAIASETPLWNCQQRLTNPMGTRITRNPLLTASRKPRHEPHNGKEICNGTNV
jgi:hypothetical protein